jgi:SAM-dependent methyltransferase
MLENVSCYVCGSSEGEPWGRENGFTALRCIECGLVYVSPRPTKASISLAAQSGLHEGSHTVDETGQRHPGKLRTYRKRLRALFESGEIGREPGRWLDIGCGFGEFLEAITEESQGRLTVVGSEPNERKAASARARALDVTFRDLATEERRYSYVSLLNVFSHVPDPPELLRTLRELLLPRGQIVLQTGNWAELERSAIPDLLHLPDHLSFASERILRRLLEASGFEVERVLRLPMFRPNLFERLFSSHQAQAPGACDLWLRARLKTDE